MTHHLYGGDNENRLKQEMLLGLGGIRTLRKLGYEMDIYHCNEGHAAMIGLERMADIINEKGLNYAEAKEIEYKIEGGNRVNIYDTVSGKFIAKDKKKKVKITIPANSSVIAVIVPAKGVVTYVGNRMLVDGVVVDYNVQNK